jgi:hypothetical protein
MPGECRASECSLVSHDLHRLGFGRVVVDPGVQVAYEHWDAAGMHIDTVVCPHSLVSSPSTPPSTNWTDGQGFFFFFLGPPTSFILPHSRIDWEFFDIIAPHSVLKSCFSDHQSHRSVSRRFSKPFPLSLVIGRFQSSQKCHHLL